MRNVAMISYHTCPLATLGGKDTGGMNVYVRDLTAELGRQGVHVDVFTRSQDEHVPHVLHDLGFGNRVVHVPAGPEQPMPKQQLAEHIPQFVDGIRQFAAERGIRYDLIHSHYWMSGLAAGQLKAEWGVPVVHMFHTLGEMKNRIATRPDEKEGAYRLDGERRVLKIADRIVAATLAEQAQLQWLYKADPRKISIIPPGVDTCHFYPIPSDEAKEYVGIPREDRMVLFVGRIEPLKGVETLIRAMSCLKVKEFERPAYLAVIGGDPNLPPEQMSAEMSRLQALCRELNMDRMVVFLGKRGQDSLPYYYSAADVLVMPSHYESFGMVALEAMACGTPVVASQVGGLAFLVQDGVTGFHVPDQDEEALCDRLTRLLGDSSLRTQMGAAAADYARSYSWRQIAGQMDSVYQGLLKTVLT
jgi:D-inositol-3-phosphate glycosyltransferase